MLVTYFYSRFVSFRFFFFLLFFFLRIETKTGAWLSSKFASKSKKVFEGEG